MRRKRGGQEIGRSRGGPSTKIHAVVDALGNPIKIALTPGQTHEMKLAYELLGDITNAYVAGDRAHERRPGGRAAVCGGPPGWSSIDGIDASALVDLLRQNGCTVVIPSNPTRAGLRDYDRQLYRERCLVEHFFQRIKRFRRIAMRFDKLARNFLAFLHLAAALVWLL